MSQNYYRGQNEMCYDFVYQCVNPNTSKNAGEKWDGKIEYLLEKSDGFEEIINGRGSSMFFIVGESERGSYICLPEWGISSEIAHLSDTFWNQERLEIRKLSTVDAITLATGLGIIATLL